MKNKFRKLRKNAEKRATFFDCDVNRAYYKRCEKSKVNKNAAVEIGGGSSSFCLPVLGPSAQGSAQSQAQTLPAPSADLRVLGA